MTLFTRLRRILGTGPSAVNQDLHMTIVVIVVVAAVAFINVVCLLIFLFMYYAQVLQVCDVS